ncbi:MAG TPA: DNA-binding response regulator [Blastocatellia bacterium]|nr:DNA-binding response regulator [Blastocatellia bacterium]
MNLKVLVVEDDRKIASITKMYLERDGYEVYLAETGTQGLRLARAHRPYLIILDLMLPQLNGLEVCQTLRAESDVHIIMLTARSTETDKLKGLDLGADDYVTKPFSPRELAARVRAVMRRQERGIEHEPPILTARELMLDLKAHQAFVSGRPLALTPREFRLLETFMKSPDRTFTREELVERVFDHSYDGFDRTVDVHIKNLRRKIEPDRLQPTYVVTVYGVGYKFPLKNE